MGIFKVIRHTDSGLGYMYNALNYVVGRHTDCDKVYSPNVNVYDAYNQFFLVKQYFNKTSGNPVYHFVVVFNTRSTFGDDYEQAESMSRSIASYFSGRYQIVYGIHRKVTKKAEGGCASFYHTHFIMNSVSYVDGKMFSGRKDETYGFLEYIKLITGDKNWIKEYGSEKQ